MSEYSGLSCTQESAAIRELKAQLKVQAITINDLIFKEIPALKKELTSLKEEVNTLKQQTRC